LETMRQAMEDVKVQMADLKKHRSMFLCQEPMSGVQDARRRDKCKADWRMIQEAEASTEYGDQERRGIELVYAIKQQQYQQQRGDA
jgi:hypothetical protein